MRTVAALIVLALLSGCSLPVFFRVPVVQGNVVTSKNVSKLKLGMTKRQVEYVMGTPLVHASFEKDRWDYVFYYRNPRAHVRQSKLNLYFVNNHLANIAGDEEYTAQVLKNAQDNDVGAAPMPQSVNPGAADTDGNTESDQNTAGQTPTAADRGNTTNQINQTGQTGPNSAGSAAPVIPQRSPKQSPLSF